ncbi:MAG TPA: MerR family transcriptional regulator [Candidatus Butyricimonas faecavium]|nr:MerR family transcriptional regulator [Candidatus Butyricimonas faecavium]
MTERETSKRKETSGVTAQVLEELSELRQEVRLAIEAASNVSCRLVDADELCRAMQISRHTLRRYEKQFKIPARKVGNKKFYFVAEVKNCIVTALRLWRE